MDITATASTEAVSLTDRERTLLGTALNLRMIDLEGRGSEVANEYDALIKKLGLA